MRNKTIIIIGVILILILIWWFAYYNNRIYLLNRANHLPSVAGELTSDFTNSQIRKFIRRKGGYIFPY